ncbi:MAG: bifunctional ornithine acetyltransferase/N-acetylglutamate synthase [Chloroflexi bacterium 13_1_40CM_4_68_4]|nr:MAG: bifunctional ornithine acetyltransferase/N-acetylglutamate synthase [Chloroflexi bacterium 13_1_40CM_4_68_4]
MSITFATGFTAGAVACGVKTGVPERLDVALVASDRPCVVAALYTTNRVVAAPLVVTRRHLAAAQPRGIVANSGNANACTGEQGERDAEAVAAAAAKAIGARQEEMVVASTGVIGVPLPAERIVRGLATVRLSRDGAADVARAIMTTDTREKTSSREVALSGGTVRIGGMAKGAGMIHPNLATMLAFITTDASIDESVLRGYVAEAADASFNAVSVDGDTSTNDMLIVLANGASGVRVAGPDGTEFLRALTEVCVELAVAIVADGEGATKLVQVRVSGARSRDDARSAARTVVASNLVKTAIHGADPNWGRILAAAGRSGAEVDDRLASVRIAGHRAFERGHPVPLDAPGVRRALEQRFIEIELELGLGAESATAWGCDLSAEYVRINAEYTT